MEGVVDERGIPVIDIFTHLTQASNWLWSPHSIRPAGCTPPLSCLRPVAHLRARIGTDMFILRTKVRSWRVAHESGRVQPPVRRGVHPIC